MAHTYRRLLRDNRDFRRLYLARLISFAGDWFLIVPLLGLVLEISDSTLATAGVLAANALPAFLVSPWAGAIADRVDRKRIMVVADLVAAVAVLGLVLVDDLESVALALAIVALVAASVAFVFPASSSALPNVVSRGELAPANVLMGSAWGTMAAVGAAAGGSFAALVGRDAAFLIDAFSFAVAAFLIGGIRRPLAEGEPAGSAGFLASAAEAIAYARRHPAVAALLTSKAGFGLIASGALVLFPVISLDVFGLGDEGTGLLFGARGLGALIGPFLFRRWFGSSDRRLVGTIGYLVALWGVGYLLLAGAPWFAMAVVAVTLAHMGGGSQWAYSTYGLQLLSADTVRGRIFGFDYGLVTLTMTISSLVVGGLAERVAVRPLVACLALLGGAFGLTWARLTRRFWHQLEHLP